ncbi:hypothetical protein CK934_08250 [Chitinophaga sp. MD30]|nr:hypothetical protein CK934_08250 [Chitinophaga sp. MD30]
MKLVYSFITWQQETATKLYRFMHNYALFFDNVYNFSVNDTFCTVIVNTPCFYDLHMTCHTDN